MARDLRSKLRRTFDIDAGDGLAPRTASGAALREYLARRRERILGAPRPKVELADGEELSNEAGTFWVRRARIPLDERHGAGSLRAADAVDWSRLCVLAKDESIGGARLEECLFLDTETTGLGGGAGTAVFLTGLAFVDGDALVLEQVFLRSFAEEPAALGHVASRLAERPLQVTFVGKSFDRHRLHTRMTLHRIPSRVLDPRHLDLYHLARRVWKAELPDCRLRTIEEHRLGLRRRDDLPGSEAPQAWLDWIRDGTGPVDRVLEHNRLDVLSLVGLLGVLGGPLTASADRSPARDSCR